MKRKNLLIIATIVILAAVILIAIYWSTRDQQGNNPEDIDNSVNTTEETAGSEDIGKVSGSQARRSLDVYLEEQDAAMSKMMTAMHEVPKSGNASINFLTGMIPHHESAIKMTDSYLKYGGVNSRLKKIADNIIAVQAKEIQDMDSMIKEIEDSGKIDEEKETAYLKEYDKMMEKHHNIGNANNGQPADVEQAFADGMIMHHQMAVEMAEAILDNTDEESVKTLAQTIIDTQKEEIEKMQEIAKEMQKAS